jgi:hypothetical protein
VVDIALLVTHCYDIYGVPIDDEGAIAEPNPDQGMQDKLVAAWDCLQVCAALCLPHCDGERCCECAVQYMILTTLVAHCKECWRYPACLLICLVC